jgi:hypothetical protein
MATENNAQRFSTPVEFKPACPKKLPAHAFDTVVF